MYYHLRNHFIRNDSIVPSFLWVTLLRNVVILIQIIFIRIPYPIALNYYKFCSRRIFFNIGEAQRNEPECENVHNGMECRIRLDSTVPISKNDEIPLSRTFYPQFITSCTDQVIQKLNKYFHAFNFKHFAILFRRVGKSICRMIDWNICNFDIALI